jgi:long-chain acyl-CoA synthetase
MTVPPKETLPHLIRRALAQPLDEVLVERVAGKWKPISSARLLQRAENVACAIREAGLDAGDRVALVAHDCVDWVVCDFATFFAGCVVVPIYPTQALDHTAYILQHSGAKLVFVDTYATLEHLRASGAPLPAAIVFETEGPDGLPTFEQRGAAVRIDHPDRPGTYETGQTPDDLAVLIYTSGTTGDPKGVMLTHDNLAFNAQATLGWGLDEVRRGDNALSVLPYSHIYEHTFIYIYLLAGVRYCICHEPNELLADLLDVRPAMMTSVPRIFDRVLAGIKGKALKSHRLQGKLISWGMRVAREFAYAKTFGGGASPALRAEYGVAKRLVLKKIRKSLGLDRMRLLTSGSAALHIDTAMTFLGLGIPIMQGYGMTETSPVITASRLTDNEYGAVGKVIPGVEIRIAEDGEVLTRGRHVMKGYYRDPEATAVMIDPDGWLHTGDVGEIDGKGFLRITDRKREVFKTDTGKWISPARIESAIKRSVYVAQAMVVGNGHPYPIALICPNWELVRVRLELGQQANDELARRDDVRQFLTAEVRTQTNDLGTHEQIRHIVVVSREFSVETGELSPAMKIKRRVVESRYAADIDRAYGADLPTPSPA